MRLRPIIPTDKESARERFLRFLCRKISEALTQRGVAHALKGGTALQIGYGLPRPSTDADFEGDERINPRELAQEALRGVTEYDDVKIGMNWWLRGTITIEARERDTRERVKVGFDYRRTGTLPGMPLRIPQEDVVTIDGIRMYSLKSVAVRKLDTLVGERPREEARDVFDAAYLLEKYGGEIPHDYCKRLHTWATNLSERKKRNLQGKFDEDEILERGNFKQALACIEDCAAMLINRKTIAEEGAPVLEGPTKRTLTLAPSFEPPVEGAVGFDIEEFVSKNPDLIPAVMMGEKDRVLFGLSTREGEMTALYAIVPGRELQFEKWLERYRYLWRDPLKQAAPGGSGAGHIVRQYRENARAKTRN